MGIWHGQLLMGGARVRFKLLGEILFIEVWDCFTIITGITHDNNNTRKSISVFGVNKPRVAGANNSATASLLAWGRLRPRHLEWDMRRNIRGGGWHQGRERDGHQIIVLLWSGVRTHDRQHSSQNMEYLALGVMSPFKYIYTHILNNRALQSCFAMKDVHQITCALWQILIRPGMVVDILKYYTEAIFIILPPSI